ncbi:MAG: TonB-dependent receptor [Halioglobus sp.]|nr:TonB-dependent receptor [Halioglobus sp.]
MTTRTRRSRAWPRTAIATALAASAAHSQAQLVLEEVIVTAQKRVESVQDISATVNVVSGDNIDRFAAFSFNEIEQQTAGLTLASPNSRNKTIALRGISVDPESGTSAAVDVYWNGAIVRPDVAFTQLYDLQRVEILRGPQGTLQGRTSPAGAINIITNRADTAESSGYVQLSATDNDGLNAQAAYGAPLIEDTLGVRVAAVYDTTAGPDVSNLTTGFDNQEIEASSARLSSVWNVTEDLSAEVIWQYLDQDQDDPKGMTGVDQLGVRPTLSPDDRKALGPSNDGTDLNFDVVNLVVDWSIMDHDVTGIVGYQNSDKESRTENDRAYSLQFLDLPAPSFQMADTEVETWTYELRAASDGNDFWDYMVGLYYQDQNTDTAFNANSVVVDQLIGFSTEGVLPVNANNYAIFTFNQFYLTEALELEVGLRWTQYDGFRRADVFYGGLNYLPPNLEPISDVVEAGFQARFPIVAVNDANSSEDAVTGSLTLRWDVLEDVSLYASYNRGYRPGGISIVPTPNIAFLPNGEGDLIYDEEESDAFEIGFKSRPLDGRASLNGALYYQQFDGYQGFVRGVQVIDPDGVAQDLPGGIVFNGDAVIWGAELEGQILLTETWNAGGALSYNDAEWDGASQPCNDREPGQVLGSCDLDGDKLGAEPEWSLSLNSEYYYPLDSTELYVRGLYKYNDDRLNEDASAGLFDVAEEFDAYYVLDLFAGWRSSDYSWDVSVWAKNVTDEDEVIYQQGPDSLDLQISGGSYTQTNILRERTFGATARYNF